MDSQDLIERIQGEVEEVFAGELPIMNENSIEKYIHEFRLKLLSLQDI